MEKKKDLRIIKTQHILYDALLNLMKDKSFEDIKVSNICATAHVNRSTFYAHYNDKYDLLVDLITSLKSELDSKFKENTNTLNTKEYFIEVIRILISNIDDNRELYKAIMINNRNSIVIDILIDVVDKDVKSRINERKLQEGSIPSDVITKFYIGGVMSMGFNWLMENKKYSEEQLLEYLNKLIPDNVDRI